MNNNIIVGVGALLTLIAVGIMVSNDGRIEQSSTPSMGKTQTVSGPETSKVVYETENGDTENSLLADESKATEKIEDANTSNIIYKGVDNSMRYAIQLIDEAETKLTNYDRISVAGSINGNRFVFKVPVELINNDLKLKIVDRDAKQEKIIDIPFTSDLQKGSTSPKINIDFDNAENYTLEQPSTDQKVFP